MRFEGSVSLKYARRFIDMVPEIADKEAAKNLVWATAEVHRRAVRSITERSPGPKETRYNPKRQVTVSQPGDAPNSDTGQLKQSVQFEVDLDSLTGYVGTNLRYGSALEFGTQNMAARPWLGPAFTGARKEIVNTLSKAFKAALKGIGKG